MMEQQIRMNIITGRKILVIGSYVLPKDRADFENWSVRGFDPENPDHLLVSAHNGNDKLGLWSFDPKEKSLRSSFTGGLMVM